MSNERTNKEWIDDNNLKIDEIKEKVVNLPEYVNIKPIIKYKDYGPIQLPRDNMSHPVAVSSMLDDYIIYTDNTDLKRYLAKYVDGNYVVLSNNFWSDVNVPRTELPYQSGPMVYILAYTNEYIYFFKGYNSSNQIVHKAAFSDLSNIIQVSTATVMSNYSYTVPLNGVQLGNKSVGNSIQYFDTETERVSSKSDLGGYNSFLTPNARVNTTANGKSVYYLNNDGTYVSKSYSELVRGVDINRQYIIFEHSIYTLTNDLTLGAKKLDLPDNIHLNTYLKSIESCYYQDNQSVYKYDIDNNVFTKQYDYVPDYDAYKDKSSFSVSNSCVYKGNGQLTEIGFNYNGENYFYKNIGNATTNDCLDGFLSYNANGEQFTGTMPNNGQLNYTPSSSAQTIPAGYTSGGTVEAVNYEEQGALSPEDTAEAEEQISDLFGEEE